MAGDETGRLPPGCCSQKFVKSERGNSALCKCLTEPTNSQVLVTTLIAFGSWITNVTCLFLFVNIARAVCGDFQNDSDGCHSRARETGGVTWPASAYRLRQDTTKRIHNMDSFGIMGEVTPFWSDQLYCHHSITVAVHVQAVATSPHSSDVKIFISRGSVKSARKRLQRVRFEVTSSMHRQ